MLPKADTVRSQKPLLSFCLSVSLYIFLSLLTYLFNYVFMSFLLVFHIVHYLLSMYVCRSFFISFLPYLFLSFFCLLLCLVLSFLSSFFLSLILSFLSSFFLSFLSNPTRRKKKRPYPQAVMARWLRLDVFVRYLWHSCAFLLHEGAQDALSCQHNPDKRFCCTYASYEHLPRRALMVGSSLQASGDLWLCAAARFGSPVKADPSLSKSGSSSIGSAARRRSLHSWQEKRHLQCFKEPGLFRAPSAGTAIHISRPSSRRIQESPTFPAPETHQRIAAVH